MALVSSRRKFQTLLVFFVVSLSCATDCYGRNTLPAINKVIDQQVATGKKQILIPAGIYVSTGPIMIDGVSAGREIASNGLVEILSSTPDPVIHIRGSKDVTIKGLSFRSVDPNEPSQPIAFYGGTQALKGRSNAITVTDSNNIRILNNNISGYWSGIYITAINNSCHDIVVKDNHVTDCGYFSIAAFCRLDWFIQKKFWERTYAFIYRIFHLKNNEPDQLMIEKIQFVGNYITRSEQGPFFWGVSDSKIDGNEVIGNIIGIRVEKSFRNEIRGNKVHRNLQGGIIIYNDSNNNIITANQIYNNNMQAAIIRKIAKKNGMDQYFLPGDLISYERTSKADHKAYYVRTSGKEDILILNKDFWPYPTSYEYITPGPRFGAASFTELKKYWGMYFCQMGGVGIELRNRASRNTIEDNDIYNSTPLSMETGYMVYGIRISQLNLIDPEEYASRENIIRNNRIRNVVKGTILDDNIRFEVNADNVY